MEPDRSGGLVTEHHSAPVTGTSMNEPVESAQDKLHEREEREGGRSRGIVIGIVAVLVLGGLGYFYFNRDTGTETASAPPVEQVPVSKDVAAAPPAVEPVRPPPAPQQEASPAPAAAPPERTPPPSMTATPSAPPTLPPAQTAETPAAQPKAPAQPQTPARAEAPAQAQPPAQAQAPTQTPPPAQAQAPTQAPPASSAPAETAAQPDPLRNQPASLPADEVMYVQKAGVNIRAEPGKQGRLVGSARKGDQFKVVGRSGTWVQVEGDGRKGWISGRLLGPQTP